VASLPHLVEIEQRFVTHRLVAKQTAQNVHWKFLEPEQFAETNSAKPVAFRLVESSFNQL
jgi:hypothetical protein